MERVRFTRLRWLLPLGFAVLLVLLPARATRAQRRSHSTKPTAWKQVTRASWYGGDFQGRRTASGQHFNLHHLTAAHRTLHLGSKVRVTELRSGRSVVVQITDRGPYLAGRGIDLSYAAARKLGIVQRGVARVQIELLPVTEPIGRPPIVTAMAGQTTAWLPNAIIE